MEGVYLIHLQRKHHHASHYIGWSSDVDMRLEIHRKGKSGVALIRAVMKSGNSISVVRVWEGADRDFERKLKNRKKARLLCPICNPKSWSTNGDDV